MREPGLLNRFKLGFSPPHFLGVKIPLKCLFHSLRNEIALFEKITMKSSDRTDVNVKVVPGQQAQKYDGTRPGDDVPEGGRGEEDDDGVKEGSWSKTATGTSKNTLSGKVYNINIYLS